MIALEPAPDLGIELRGRPAHREGPEKMIQQQFYVAGSVPERRYLDHYRIDSVVKVPAEFALVEQSNQVFVGGTDKSYVGMNGPITPHFLELLVLYCAKELGLGVQRHIRNFVEQQSAAVGSRQLAFPTGHSRGHVTGDSKQFTFNHRLRDGRAVEFNQGAIGSTAPLVKHLADDLLAGPALPLNEHGNIGVRDLGKSFEHGQRTGVGRHEIPGIAVARQVLSELDIGLV